MEFLKIEVNGKVYKTEGFPKVGQFINIETYKQILSSGMYDKMVVSQTTNGRFSADLVAAEAYIVNLFPDYAKTIGDFGSMDIMEAKSVVEIYRKQILPQVNEISKMLSDLSIDE